MVSNDRKACIEGVRKSNLKRDCNGEESDRVYGHGGLVDRRYGRRGSKQERDQVNKIDVEEWRSHGKRNRQTFFSVFQLLLGES